MPRHYDDDDEITEDDTVDPESAVRIDAVSRLKVSFKEYDNARRYAVSVLGPADVDFFLDTWGGGKRAKPV